MIARLRSRSAFVRETACTVLGELRDRSATPRLLAILSDEPGWIVRRAAAFALASLADPQSGPAILRHYEGRREDNNVRMGLERAMAALGIPFTTRHD
jgi:HEAT repeat protein